MSLLSSHEMTETEPLHDINITPLIDVMLVLLIMFIITIPVQLHAVNLQSVSTHGTVSQKPLVVQIAIEVDNTLLWEGKALADKSQLETRLTQLQNLTIQQRQQPEFHIKAHPRSKYGYMAFVMAAVQRHGFVKINIVE